MIHSKIFRLKAQLSVLKDIMHDYRGLTIENIIQQIESRIKHLTANDHD